MFSKPIVGWNNALMRILVKNLTQESLKIHQKYFHAQCFRLQQQNSTTTVVKLSDELISLSNRSDLNTRINALDTVTEDNVELLNEMAPSLKKSFNLAAYVNSSDTLQQLVKLNVDLSKIEKNHHIASFIVKCDFDEDIKPLLLLLLDNGVNIKDVGYLFTKNPFLFAMHLEDLKTRINYFKFRKFSKTDIATMLVQEPNVFNLKVKTIDQRLADLKQEYSLTADNIRRIARKHPRIILLDQLQVKKCTFMLAEEMGFKSDEIKSIIIRHPCLWTKYFKSSGHKNIMLSFEYVHNTMAIPHELILKYPMILTLRVSLIRGRHLYLKLLKRDQYDPTKPLYVPLGAFFTMDDSEFCLKYCKTSVGDFNEFLKSI